MIRITITQDEHNEVFRLHRIVQGADTRLQLPDNVKSLTSKTFAEKALQTKLAELGSKYGYAPESARIAQGDLSFTAIPNHTLRLALSAIVAGLLGGMLDDEHEKLPAWVVEGLIAVGLLEIEKDNNGRMIGARTTNIGQTMLNQHLYANIEAKKVRQHDEAANDPTIQ